MGNRIRSKTNGGLDILGNKLRICLQEIRFRCFFAKLAQDELDRYASPPDHRLSSHDLGIDIDAIINSHSISPLDLFSQIVLGGELGTSINI
jgi:hypothetical protein